MAFNRGSFLVRQAILRSRRASSEPISTLLNSSNYFSGNDDENNCYFNLKKFFVSSTQHLNSPRESGSSDTPTAASYHLQGGPSHMRAAVFWNPSQPLTFEDFHMPRPKANEVLIKTKGIGKHFSSLTTSPLGACRHILLHMHKHVLHIYR